MRVAVTGGAGFIGSRLCRVLAQAGHEPIALDLRPDAGAAWKSSRVDVLNLESLEARLQGVEALCHLAGPVAGTAKAHPFESARLQMSGTLNALEACRRMGVGKFILASSFYAYAGIAESATVDEETPLAPPANELFAALKHNAERLARAFSSSSGLSAVILRYGSVYGPGTGSNAVRQMFEDGMAGRGIVVWGHGRRRNQYTFVDDAARGTVAALTAEPGVYNLISEEVTTTAELAGLLGRRFGFPVAFDPKRSEAPSMARMSSGKARSELGWIPTPLARGLDLTAAEVFPAEAFKARDGCDSKFSV